MIIGSTPVTGYNPLTLDVILACPQDAEHYCPYGWDGFGTHHLFFKGNFSEYCRVKKSPTCRRDACETVEWLKFDPSDKYIWRYNPLVDVKDYLVSLKNIDRNTQPCMMLVDYLELGYNRCRDLMVEAAIYGNSTWVNGWQATYSTAFHSDYFFNSKPHMSKVSSRGALMHYSEWGDTCEKQNFRSIVRNYMRLQRTDVSDEYLDMLNDVFEKCDIFENASISSQCFNSQREIEMLCRSLRMVVPRDNTESCYQRRIAIRGLKR